MRPSSLRIRLELRPKVFLLHRSAEERSGWREVLGDSCVLDDGATVAEATERLADGSFDLLVTEWFDGLDEAVLGAWPGAKILHVGEWVTSRALDASEGGAEVYHAPSARALAAKVHAIVRKRRLSVRHGAPKGFGVSFEGSGDACTLLDISADGFAFLDPLEKKSRREPVLVGQRLREVRITDGAKNEVVASVDAVARRIGVLRGKGYVVGCTFLPRAGTEPRDTSGARSQRIDDELMVAATLRAATKAGPIVFRGMSDDGVAVEAERVELGLRRGWLEVLSGSSNSDAAPSEVGPFREHDVVRGTFELAGCKYAFLSSVMSEAPLRLSLPRALEEQVLRRSPRVRFDGKVHPRVVLPSPVDGAVCDLTVDEMSTHGFSVLMLDGEGVFPPGLRIPRLTLTLGDSTISTAATVRHVTRLCRDATRMRVGLRLENLSDGHHASLSSYLLEQRVPGIRDGGRLPFAELWQLLRATAIVNAELEDRLRPLASDVQTTFERLRSAPPSLFRSFALADDKGALNGHVSALHIYRPTWYVGHLASTSLGRGSLLLNAASAEFLAQLEALEFLRLHYAATNRWSGRVFGGFARKLSDPSLSDLRRRTIATLSSDAPALPTAGVSVAPATRSELLEVEQVFVGTLPSILVRAEDLTRSGLELDEMHDEFESAGLRRQRTVFVARAGDTPVAIALAELSSPGLSLQERFSSAHFFPLPKVAPLLATHALRGVHNALSSHYRSAGRPFFGIVVDERDEPLLEALGPCPRSSIMVWTCHRLAYQRLMGHLERTFRLAARRALQDTPLAKTV